MSEHGTHSRYVGGCRCDSCRKGERDSRRAWYRRTHGVADIAEVMRKLRRTAGSGGVRLSYGEAALVLALIEAGAKAVARERSQAPTLEAVLAERRRLNEAAA